MSEQFITRARAEQIVQEVESIILPAADELEKRFGASAAAPVRLVLADTVAKYRLRWDHLANEAAKRN